MKTVFVSGCFNVLHPGHLRLLRFAKECGDRLVVGVMGDLISGENAHIPEKLRLEGVLANSYVDKAFIFNDCITDVVQKLKPDIVVKGKEHESKINPELEILKKYSGELIFCSGESIFSSIDLLRREFNNNSKNEIDIPHELFQRHSIHLKNLLRIVNNFSKLKVCVIGDLIVDEYITCQALGMSQEEPTIVVTPIDKTRFIGGAAIVAAHAASLGAKTDFVTVAGDDEVAEYAKKQLKIERLNSMILNDESRPTTLKQRYRSKGKSLLRVNQLHQNSISDVLKNTIFSYIEKNIKKYKLIVFSDFNYGCLPQDLVQKIITLARKNKVFLAADSQSSSQVGDVSRYKNVDLITPTEYEARIALKNNEDGLVVLADSLSKNMSVRNVILKMGEEGILIHIGDAKDGDWVTDKIPALNASPKDVSGAGDSLLITCSMSMALGGTIWEAASLGSIAAGIQISRVGNSPINKAELIDKLNT